MYICRAPESVERVRLQPPKATLPFRVPAQAARHQPKQPRTTHASSSPAQDDSCLQQPRMDDAKSDQLFFYRGHSSFKSRATGRPTLSPNLTPWALQLTLPPAQE